MNYLFVDFHLKEYAHLSYHQESTGHEYACKLEICSPMVRGNVASVDAFVATRR
jgi:hypothetical protein